MRRIDFDPDAQSGTWTSTQRDWWLGLLARAKAAVADLGSSTTAPEAFAEDVWRDIRDWLLEYVFFDKCAMCEARVGHAGRGEGDHYRPKKRVKIPVAGGWPPGKVKWKVLAAAVAGQSASYFWMAYDWTNLIPLCSICNNTKSDKFPVAGQHVFDPTLTTRQLNERERPLLINPYYEDPVEFLRYGITGGIVAIDGNSRGAATIEVYGLDRAALAIERARKFERMGTQLLLKLNSILCGDNSVRDAINDFLAHDEEYSSACDQVVDEIFDNAVDSLRSAPRVKTKALPLPLGNRARAEKARDGGP